MKVEFLDMAGFSYFLSLASVAIIFLMFVPVAVRSWRCSLYIEIPMWQMVLNDWLPPAHVKG